MIVRFDDKKYIQVTKFNNPFYIIEETKPEALCEKGEFWISYLNRVVKKRPEHIIIANENGQLALALEDEL